MKYLLLGILTLVLVSVFLLEKSTLELAQGWQAEVITECGDDMPDMLMLSADKKRLYQSCETKENMLSPSLARIDIATGKREILLYGLGKADGMRFAPDGSLWIGEEQKDGMIWRVESPDTLMPEQRADRQRLLTSSQQVQAIPKAGIFSHEGLMFSQDGQYLYLADEWSEGCLYRFILSSQMLEVFHDKKGWLKIHKPEEARLEAERLHGKWFERMEDMEMLSDGRVLIAETGAGRILVLDDRGDKPHVAEFLKHAAIKHPDNLEWDHRRGWLWISDDSHDSELWAWDGEVFKRIALHTSAEITGIESDEQGNVYFNLQHRRFAPDLTMRIFQPQ